MRTFRAIRPLDVLAAVAVAIFAVLAGEALVGAATVGVSVDEPTHLDRFNRWLDDGLYVPSFALADGEIDPANAASTPYVYGAVFSVLSHLANVAVGNEAIDEISASSDAFAVRHVVAALLGLAAAAAVGLAVRGITTDGLAGLWAATALLAIPVWTGNSMFNIKDTPAGAGYTLVTVGLVIALARLGEDEPSAYRRWGVGGLVGIGVLFGVGTRPALWLPLALAIAAFAVLSWLLLGSPRRTLRPLAPPVLGFAAGLALVAAVHPQLAKSPIDWLIGSVNDSGSFSGFVGHTLTAGRALEAPGTPFWYLPAWVFAGVPLLIFGLGVLGLGVYARRALALLPEIRRTHEPSDARIASVPLVVMQLVLLPIAAIVAGSPMYSGLRQHLYVLPAVAMLAGLGAAALIRRVRRSPGSPAWRHWLPVVVLTLALLAPTLEQTRLYPYNYVYVNPLAGIRGVQGEWATELQWISGREAFDRVPAGVEPGCSPWLVLGNGQAGGPLIFDCGIYLEPYRDEPSDNAATDARPAEVWVVGRSGGDNRPPDYCREVDSVTRALRGEDVVMSYVLRCTPPPEAFGTAPITPAVP